MGLLAMFAACLYAAEPVPNKLTKDEKKQGWILLFDGKSLKEWNDPRKKSPPGDGWAVENGTIRTVARPSIREDLISNRKFRDFEFAFDWKLDKRSNSGVKYRVQGRFYLDKAKQKKGVPFEEQVGYELANKLSDRTKPSPEGGEEYVIAFEYQLIDNSAHPDAMRGSLYQTGGLYSMIAPDKQMSKPVGEWNTSRIVLRGETVQHWLNGEKVMESRLDAEPIRKAVAKRWEKHAPELYRKLADQPEKECPVALQHHNDAVWFRNLKIRPLPASGN